MAATRYIIDPADPEAYVELHDHADTPESRHNVRCDVCRQIRQRVTALGYVQVCGPCVTAMNHHRVSRGTPTTTGGYQPDQPGLGPPKPPPRKP